MSMISGQVDRLRTAAQTYRRLGNHTAEGMFLEAADTIWELRDDLQRANAENVKLREELADAPKCETCEAMLDCDECLRADGSHKERRRLNAENAKLRERVAELDELLPENGRWFSAETVEAYVAEIAKLRELVDYMTPIAWYAASERERDRMRELGMEAEQ